MKTTIILGSFNGEKYIERQIKSFFNQTVLPSELIINDDCSTDNTVEIIRQLIKTSPFPIILNHNTINLGYTANFENLLKVTDADIIFFSDQDDLWFPTKIEKVLSIFEKSASIMVVINDMILATENLTPTEFTQLQNIRNVGMSDDTFVAGCAVAIRKQWKEVVLPFPENYEGHDNWINRLATITNCRQIFERPLQLYRRHQSNVSISYASQPKKVNQLNSALQHGLNSAEEGWKNELIRIILTKNRLLQRKDFFVSANLEIEFNKALKNSAKKINAYNKRIKYVGKNKISRVFPLFIMFLEGDYHYFSGYKSLIKDLIR